MMTHLSDNIKKGNIDNARCFRLAPLAVLLLLMANQAYAQDTFNVHALELDNPDSTPVDISQFSEPGEQAPGKYRVDIYMNGELQDTRDVSFVTGPDGKLQPQLTPTQLENYGVDLHSIPDFRDMPGDKVISDLSKYIPQSSTDFRFDSQKLLITVPQITMKPSAQGAVDPKYWDEGMPAAIANYNFTGSNTKMDEDGSRDNSYFLNLRSGINLGGWRLRNYSTWNYNSSDSHTENGKGDDENNYSTDTENEGSQSSWDSINTYLQHDLPAIRGQFTAGDSYTPSDVFDSIQFRGAQVASDDNMLPDSQRGFAPTVRGIANSNAQVTVRQNGAVIYQTYVPPGAFSITDLYPTSSSGDLQVTIKEASGQERTFLQPFSNVPVMQREDRLKYAFTAGEYRAPYSDEDEPVFGQATVLYGLPHDVTVYGGLQTSGRYNALAGGMGFSLGELGSASVDATQANTTLDNGNSKEGQSYRFQYSKDIAATDSTVTLAGYRYSTEGFYTFQEALDYQAYERGDYSSNLQNNKRSKIQIDLSQNLMGGDLGSLSFSGYQQDYWNEEGYERNASVSYSNSWNSITWTVMYTYSEQPYSENDNDQQLAISVSIPLSKWLPNAYANTNTTTDMHGKTSNQAGISGTALEDSNLSYSVSSGYGNRGEGSSGMANADYKGTYGEVNGGYNYSNDSQQINYGAQGAIVAHPYGITLAQSAGDMASMALVRAPGADGAKVENNTGVHTDWRGYTIVPYLSSYRRTRIALDPQSLSDDVDIEQNVQTVVPTAGALVMADFKTRTGGRVLMNLMHGQQAVPFGATVSLVDDETNTGIVGEQGQVYLSGVPQKGTLMAKWGNGSDEQCSGKFALPANDDNKGQNSGVQQMSVNCG